MDSDDLERVLGQNIRATRIDQGLRQVDLADRANVSLGALKHLESGTGSSTTTLAKVLRALGRGDWLDTLAPRTPSVDPLAMLEERERSARSSRGGRRVHRRPVERLAP